MVPSTPAGYDIRVRNSHTGGSGHVCCATRIGGGDHSVGERVAQGRRDGRVVIWHGTYGLVRGTRVSGTP